MSLLVCLLLVIYNFNTCGGNGLIGKALKAKLLSKGINVRIISRDPRRSKTVESSGLPEDTHAVINLSGRSIGEINSKFLLSNTYNEFLEEVRSINETFYQRISYCYCEEDRYEESGFLSRLVHDWEAACSGPQLDGIRRVIVRVGIVLSKHGGALANMYASHRLGLAGPIGDGKQWFSWIHIDDLVNIFCFLLTDPSGQKLDGPVNGTAPNPVRQGAFSRALCQSLGAPSFGGRIPTPAFVVKAMLGAHRAPLLLEGQRVLPVKATAAGFQFQYPTLESAFENLYGRKLPSVPTD
nr:epimerase family protein sdr39u1 [Hymenolepis microstoma]